jgi:TolA-binding protein
MKRDDRALDRELEEMLERGRAIRPLPDVVRARALARARATEAAAADSAAAPAAMPPTRGHGRRIALAAGLALLVGAAGAGAAIRGGVLERFRPTPPPAPSPRVSPPRPQSPPAVIQEPESNPKAIEKRRSARPPTAQESYAAELSLPHRAHVAYASRDFSSALVLVAEHARRYPNGRLAEEREALRIRSLAGSGRTADARRAIAAFAARFPRSVLLPRLQETPEAAD